MIGDPTVKRVVGGSALILAVTLGLVRMDRPAPDADQPIARETPEGLLVTEALDTAYASPEPAPSEPWLDSLSLCRVRAIQVGASIPMRPPYRLHFRACESAVDGHGPWRELVTR